MGRRVIQLTVTISFLIASPVFAQEVPRFEWRAAHLRDAGLKLTERISLSGERVLLAFQYQPRSPALRTLQWGGAGAIGGGLLGFVIGGLMNGAASGSLDEALTFADAIGRRGTPDPDHPCFDKNCALIGAGIGAGAGFVIGAIAGATTAPRAAGGRRRPQPPPLCSGSQR